MRACTEIYAALNNYGLKIGWVFFFFFLFVAVKVVAVRYLIVMNEELNLLIAAIHRLLACSHCSHAESHRWLKWMRSHKPLIPTASPYTTLSGSLVHLQQHRLAPTLNSKSEVLNASRLIIIHRWQPKTTDVQFSFCVT